MNDAEPASPFGEPDVTKDSAVEEMNSRQLDETRVARARWRLLAFVVLGAGTGAGIATALYLGFDYLLLTSLGGCVGGALGVPVGWLIAQLGATGRAVQSTTSPAASLQAVEKTAAGIGASLGGALTFAGAFGAVGGATVGAFLTAEWLSDLPLRVMPWPLVGAVLGAALILASSVLLRRR